MVLKTMINPLDFIGGWVIPLRFPVDWWVSITITITQGIPTDVYGIP
jgi:hypothetical protein